MYSSPDSVLNILPIEVFGLNGSVNVDICNIENFDYRYIGNFGFYMSIPSPITGVNWQFPYEILVDLDSNKQQFPDMIQCDFSGPRVVEFGIVNPKPIYDTTNGEQNITVSFTITDDLSGFYTLKGTIRSNSTETFYLNDFLLDSYQLVSGNLNNGVYEMNITIPQYCNGTYQIGIYETVDHASNKRHYTTQNSVFLSSTYTFEAYTPDANPFNPSIESITLTQIGNQNTLVVTLDSSSTNEQTSMVLTLSSRSEYPFFGFTKISAFIYQLNNLPTLAPGIYYFNLCIDYSLSIKCFSSLDLEQLGFINSLYLYDGYL